MNHPLLYKKYKLECHNECKPLFLELIEESIEAGRSKPNPAGYVGDYPLATRKFYDEEFKKYLIPIINQYASEHNCNANVGNYWFQQYPHNTKFFWHNHPGGHLAMVYNLELDNSIDSLKLYSDGVIEVNMNEGDVIVFPAYVPHLAPNVTGDRKTTIACNFDLNVDFNKFRGV